MSWILGYAGSSRSPDLRERLASLHGPALHVANSPEGYVSVGGLPEMCHFETDDAGNGWAVVGLGLRRQENACVFLDTDNWRTRLSTATPRLGDLDGHFTAVRWRGGRLETFTDVLGVRTLYLTEIDGSTVFSTRLDWLARLRGEAEIDLGAFGGHWLLFNQLSTHSLVRGIRRIVPAPDAWRSSAEEDPFEQVLTAFLRPRQTSDRLLSLGLSGGLDSRLLLSLRPRDYFAAHSFGHPDHPDVRLARRLAADVGVPYLRFHEPVPDADACLVLLRAHVAQTQAVSPASSVLGLGHYPALREAGAALIDGGFGEITRRQFLNRLLLRGRRALLSHDAHAMLPYLRFPRADVFSEDAHRAMEAGARRQIETLLASIPDELASEDSLDWISVQARLPNFFGFEQSRLDGLIANYMPFAQPAVLRAAFRLPLAERRGGRLVRRLIRHYAPVLARRPLVKGGHTYPFRFPPLPAYAWTKAQASLGYSFVDPTRREFLSHLRSFALDTAHSQAVRELPLYDASKLQTLVKRYYDGQDRLAGAVDWWLALEVWRQALESH